MATGLRFEEGALHLLMETHTLQQQIDDVREAQYIGEGMQAATEEDQGPQRGRIRLEETYASDHPSLEHVGTLDLPCPERDRHFLSRENHRRIVDRGRPLNEKGYFHRLGRDMRDANFLLPGTHGPGFRRITTTVMQIALLLQYGVLSMPLASLPRSLLVALHLIFIQKG